MELASLTRPELIFPRLDCANGTGLLRFLAERVAALGYVDNAESLYERLVEREELGSTGVGGGVAIPHCKMKGLERVVLAVGLTTKPIDFAALDQEPVRLFFLVISPTSSPAAHLQCLAAISKWVKHVEHVRSISELEDPQEILQRLQSGE